MRFAGSLGTVVISDGVDPVTVLLGSPPLLGTVFGLVVASLWLAGARRAPGRVAPTSDGGESGFGRGFATGVLLVCTPGVPLLLATSVNGIDDHRDLARAWASGGVLLALSVVAGVAVGLHELLVKRSDRTGRASPEEFLRRDRRSALAAAVVTSLVVAMCSVLAATLAATLGGHVGERIAISQGFPTVAHPLLPPLSTHMPWTLTAETCRCWSRSAWCSRCCSAWRCSAPGRGPASG
ncbi:hypothetical protein ALI22I_17140 [Saccharothrix sp. ALI-22-I]|uniref:hypothetical protein n=1 Tax=Saccharothrix sp. ALI-22-I TaxID=1933778 RepID=UPI00097BCFBA|nr:hypothetical protein [Saccharothrix sp. ALI-22-I]ONI89220.1 hypothetical protein ALI22I_17140 [Saccharothrix sp. ALI-22-I]